MSNRPDQRDTVGRLIPNAAATSDSRKPSRATENDAGSWNIALRAGPVAGAHNRGGPVHRP